MSLLFEASARYQGKMSESGFGSGNGSFSGNDSQYCKQLEQTENHLLYALLGLAVVIVILLSFTYRRVHLCKRVLWGVPGLVVPVNLVSPTRFRFVYAFIFGAISSTLLGLVFSSRSVTFITVNTHYLDIFVNTVVNPALIILMYLFLYFPLFACVDTPFPLIGHIVGLLYTCILVAQRVITHSVFYSGCSGVMEPATVAIEAVGYLPIYVCYLVILVWYFCRIVVDIVDIYKAVITEGGQAVFVQKKESQYHIKYVKSLLKVPAVQHKSQMRKVMSDVYDMFALNKGLRLPLKFLGVLVVMLIILYQLSFLFFTLTANEGRKLADFWQANGRDISNRIFGNTSSSNSLYQTVLSLLQGFTAVFALASFLSFVICLALLVHMAYSVQQQLKTAMQGKFYLLVPSLRSPSFRLAASLKYAGFQIGFFVWAWLIYWILIVLFGLAAMAVYFLYKDLTSYALYYTTYVLFPVFWSFVIYYLQVLLCKLVFIKKGGGKFINITNRRLWNWFEYVFFFYNTIVGFFAAILRIMVAALFSLLLLFRLDTVILMKGFEFGDTGHMAFIGFLYLEYTYNNAVVNMFVKLMTEAVSMHDENGYVSPTEEVEANLLQPQRQSRISQARNRWLVAYTLLRNPSLQELTASKIRNRNTQEVATMNAERGTSKGASNWIFGIEANEKQPELV